MDPEIKTASSKGEVHRSGAGRPAPSRKADRSAAGGRHRADLSVVAAGP
jgi:hypothetical protein